MGMLALVLFAVALVAFVTIMVRVAGRRRRLRRPYRGSLETEDDSPTGYVQGVWMLGGADSAKPRESADRRRGEQSGARRDDESDDD